MKLRLTAAFAQSLLHAERSQLRLLALSPTTTRRMSTPPDTTATATDATYVPPKVWTYENSDGSKFSMNRPTAGSRFDEDLPVGKHPIQLYSLATPNGQKVTVLLEELLEAGKDAEYDAWYIDIMASDQFGSDFVSINPNSKIPALRLYESPDKEPLRLFESGSILLHLAEKYDCFLPKDDKRAETLNWLFWQMGSAPYLGGGFGHFYAYADVKQKYPIDRFTMEAKRQLDVLEKNLADRKYIVGDQYTIADIAIFTWYGRLVLGKLYGDAATFLNVKEDYPNVIRWAEEIGNRPAVKRGLLVNGKVLRERHAAKDFDGIDLDITS
jgi:GSH-dependent disulfide-bond oxidoreductase